MIVSHEKKVKGVEVINLEVKNILKKVLISPAEGWEGNVMRLFELEEGGHTPRHKHPWPHINYVVKGEGVLFLDGENYDLTEGSFAFVPGGKVHQFANNEKSTFKIICIVPEEGDK